MPYRNFDTRYDGKIVYRCKRKPLESREYRIHDAGLKKIDTRYDLECAIFHKSKVAAFISIIDPVNKVWTVKTNVAIPDIRNGRLIALMNASSVGGKGWTFIYSAEKIDFTRTGAARCLQH